MKIRPIVYCAALATLVPLLAQAATGDSIERCMDAFASKNFPDSRVTLLVEGDRQDATPLIARTGTQSVQLVATAKSNGRVLAKTTCQVRESGNREGQVTVMPLGNGEAN